MAADALRSRKGDAEEKLGTEIEYSAVEDWLRLAKGTCDFGVAVVIIHGQRIDV